MDFIFYKYSGKTNILNKRLPDGRTIKGDFNEAFNLSDCNIKLSFMDFFDENYVYIPKLKKYYFVTNKTFHRTGMLYLQCHIDVLMTYKDEILNSKIMLAQGNTNIGNVFNSVDFLNKNFNNIMVTLGG